MLIRNMGYTSVIWFWCFICSSFASTIKFLPSTSFNVPSSFRDGKLPCSKETVVFPESLMTYIKLESDTHVDGLILPIEGDIILADGTIEFGADEDDVNCTHQGNVYYMDKSVVTWSQADIWSSPRFNDATPDSERVPCYDDIVEFPSDQFTITLPDLYQDIAGIKINNVTLTSTAEFIVKVAQLDLTEQFVYSTFLGIGLDIKQAPCQSRAGCPCQKHPLTINCETKFCPVPTCVYPIKPEGHCCKICGGVIVFGIDESFDMMVFREFIERTVESYGIDSLLYHIARLPNNRVQLVVVDKLEYSGKSAELVNAIDHQMEAHWVQGAKLVDISGTPLYKSGLGGKIFVSMFFLVVLVMGGIYAYYYKLPDISNVRFPILHRATPGVFSRFQTRTDSVVCLTRRDSETGTGTSDSTDFRNPLYDSMGKRVEVEDTGSDE